VASSDARIPMSARRAGTALLFSSVVGVIGLKRHALSPSGVLGAVVVGTAIQLAGRWRWSALLLSFFVTSSALSRLRKAAPSAPAHAAVEVRGSRRDLVQALANGGVAAGIAVMHGIAPSGRLESAFAGSFAAANADTWATEIGKTSASRPRLITTWRTAPPGTSGAVTARGLAASVAGSATIAVVEAAATGTIRKLRVAFATSAAGVIGSLVDSLAGATIQAAYHCPTCDKATERPLHGCGTRTVLISGFAWCTNDVVNVLCTGAGAVAGALLRPRD
jgi:uncharacterized protein (TIGR00297 family)